MAYRDLVPYSWDGHQINDGTNYEAGIALPGDPWGLPKVSIQMVERTQNWPAITGVRREEGLIRMWIKIVASDVRTARDNLINWFDPSSEQLANLVIKDEDGSDSRYITGLCSRLVPITYQGFWVDILVDGNPRWRSTSETGQTWTITATGDTEVVNNTGTADAYPTLEVTPTSAKAGASDYTYQRFIAIRWKVDDSASGYPVDVVDNSLDTATLVSAGKMQADGDDLRIKVNGSEVDRWLQDINDATTQVWINMTFQPKWEGTIVSAIGAGDTVTSIVVNESLTGLPSTGLICINSEIFSFTAANASTKTITIGERAAKASTAAGHSADDAIWWVQHDVSILYGNAGASAPSADDDYKPIIELDSTNTSWDYNYFGDDDGKRTASWSFAIEAGANSYGTPLKKYTANRETDATPWEEMGVKFSQWGQTGLWKITNPCGITVANFQNGEVKASSLTHFYANIYSGSPEFQEDVIASPGEGFPVAADTWEAWSDSETLQTGATSAWLRLHPAGGYKPEGWLEVSDVTLTLNSSNTPTIALLPEETSYGLVCTIENTTTGKSISIDYSGLATNESITIDTEAKTVTDDQDGTSQFQALTVDDGPRLDWLALEPGNNTLEYTDVNTQGISIDITFRPRYT